MATTDTHSAYTASRQGARRRLWPRILLIALLVLASIAAIAFFANRTAINGYAVTGAAYAARRPQESRSRAAGREAHDG